MQVPFPRLTYEQAMARFGSDKPDIRFGMELIDLTDIGIVSGFGVFSQAAQAGGQVKASRAAGAGGYSRQQLDELGEMAKRWGAKGLIWMIPEHDGVRSPAAKYLIPDEVAAIQERTGAVEGDLLLVVADQPAVVDDQQAGHFQPGERLQRAVDRGVRLDFRVRPRTDGRHGLLGQRFLDRVAVMARLVIAERIDEFFQVVFQFRHR